jgi:hypothetical protein
MTRTLRIGLSLAVAALVLVAGWAVSSHGATAGSGPAVAVDSATAAVGETTNVNVSALDMADPGLGAWSLNVVYDAGVLEQQGCDADNGSVCNPTFAEDTVRISGATAEGMPGDSILATIDFRCTQVGSSPLTLTVDTLADGTPGAPQDIDAEVISGSVTCLVPSTPTTPPPSTPGNGDGGSGFPAAGGTYVGSVPGQGTVTVVIEPNGQGIKGISITNLVTICGTINQVLSFDPPLDIQEPGFHFDLFTISEGAAVLSMDGFFAENGTIPVDLIVDTSNEDFPGGASPCSSSNQVIPLVLVRQSDSTVVPPSGGSSGGGSTGGSLPDAGSGPTLGIDAQNPITWLVAAMIGAGVAWLSAGVAGAGLSTVSAPSGRPSTPTTSGFTPSLAPSRKGAAATTSIDTTATVRNEPAPIERPRTKRTTPDLGGQIDAFRAPKRPDRP